MDTSHIILFSVFTVSNEVPEHPVVSPVSGHVFERRLIEKYVNENGTDPLTGGKLQVDMLIDIKSELFYLPEKYVVHANFIKLHSII